MYRPCMTMTVKEAAQVLGIPETTVRDLEARGALSRISKLPGVRFRKRDVFALVGEKETDMSPAAFRRLNNQLAMKDAEIRRLKENLHMISESAITAEKGGAA